MRDVPEVAEQQLQRVLARLQLDGRFALALAEVNVLRIGGTAATIPIPAYHPAWRPVSRKIPM